MSRPRHAGLSHRVEATLALLAALGCTSPKPIHSDGGGARDASSACRTGYLDCDPSATACETWGWADHDHCGDCTIQCEASQCVAGVCEVPDAVQVAVGIDVVCARLANGRVLCWGRNDRGQLGDGTADGTASFLRASPAAVLDVEGAVDLAVGASTACVIVGEGREVRCWGDNLPARIGPADLGRFAPRPLPLFGTDQPVLQVAVGWRHTCVRTLEDVLCAGANSNGQFGQPGPSSAALVRMEGLPRGSAPASVAVGGRSASNGFTVVALGNGEVYAVGDNEYGQCGAPGGGTVAAPTRIDGLENIVQVAAGGTAACALDRSGRLYCWGGNEHGQLGRGTFSESEAPALVAGDTLFAEVSMQRDAVWGLAASRSELFGWGEAEDGALGLGDPPPAAVPEPIWIVIEPGADLQGSTGGRMGCYRLARGDEPGDVFCAGQNDYGELGREPGEPASTFAPVPFFE